MYLQFYGLREQPFGVTPDPGYLYMSATHREALASLMYAVEAGVGFSALVAPPGMGKTSLLYALLRQFQNSAETAFLFDTQGDSRELLRNLVAEFELDREPIEDGRLLPRLREFLLRNAHARRRVLVLVDEAQNLEAPVLETLRLLSNFETAQAKLLQIVLAGQSEFAGKLARPELEHLRQRIAIFCRLTPFTPAETVDYMVHRLRRAGYQGGPLFTAEALAILVANARGIPREINRLCFNALSLGFAMQSRLIDAGMVREVVADLQRDGLLTREHSPAPAANTAIPAELGMLFHRFMAQARVAKPHAVEPLGNAPAKMRPHEGWEQPPGFRLAQAGPDSQHRRMGGIGTIGLSQAPKEASRPRRNTRRTGIRAAFRRGGLIAVAAAVILAGLVWSGVISSSTLSVAQHQVIAAIRDRAPMSPLARPVTSSPSGAGNQEAQISSSAPVANDPDVELDETRPAAGDRSDGPGKNDAVKRVPASGSRDPAPSPRVERSLVRRFAEDLSPAPADTTTRLAANTPIPPPGNSAVSNASQPRFPSSSSSPAPATIPPVPAPPAVNSVGVDADGRKMAALVATTPVAPPSRLAEPDPPSTAGRRLLTRVDPIYPQAARTHKIWGQVVLAARIGASGQVEAVHPVSGNPLLASAAMDAVRQWVYEPIPRETQSSNETIIVNFSLH
jgi:TonB family protein